MATKGISRNDEQASKPVGKGLTKGQTSNLDRRSIRTEVTPACDVKLKSSSSYAIFAHAFAEAKRVVAPAGFEPAISALRGLRPRPLDDGAAI